MIKLIPGEGQAELISRYLRAAWGGDPSEGRRRDWRPRDTRDPDDMAELNRSHQLSMTYGETKLRQAALRIFARCGHIYFYIQCNWSTNSYFEAINGSSESSFDHGPTCRWRSAGLELPKPLMRCRRLRRLGLAQKIGSARPCANEIALRLLTF